MCCFFIHKQWMSDKKKLITVLTRLSSFVCRIQITERLEMLLYILHFKKCFFSQSMWRNSVILSNPLYIYFVRTSIVVSKCCKHTFSAKCTGLILWVFNAYMFFQTWSPKVLTPAFCARIQSGWCVNVHVFFQHVLATKRRVTFVARVFLLCRIPTCLLVP